MSDPAETERRVEALLFAASAPLSAAEIGRRLPEGAEVGPALAQLQARYAERGVSLVCVADRWRFQTAADLAFLMTEERQEPRRLSRAALETLAIVAYKQPVSRAQVSSIRGVSVDGVMRTLQQRGYVEEVARDPGPGQAVLYGTTRLFLEKLGLDTLSDLPPLADFVPGPETVELLEQGLRVGAPEADVDEPAEGGDGD